MNDSILNGKAKVLSTLMLGAMLTLGVAGMAQAEGKKMDSSGNAAAAFDTNKDGMVSKEEATSQGMPDQVFTEADSNGDGMLSKDEFSSAISAKTGMPATGMPPSTDKPSTEMPMK